MRRTTRARVFYNSIVKYSILFCFARPLSRMRYAARLGCDMRNVYSGAGKDTVVIGCQLVKMLVSLSSSHYPEAFRSFVSSLMKKKRFLSPVAGRVCVILASYNTPALCKPYSLSLSLHRTILMPGKKKKKDLVSFEVVLNCSSSQIIQLRRCSS